jgi:hypothetical protein
MNLRKEHCEYSMDDISLKLIASGQKGAYKDSVTEYEVESELGAKITEKLLVRDLIKTSNKTTSIREFSGSCGFPFGLEKFYGFWLTEEETKFKLKICYPYCD